MLRHVIQTCIVDAVVPASRHKAEPVAQTPAVEWIGGRRALTREPRRTEHARAHGREPVRGSGRRAAAPQGPLRLFGREALCEQLLPLRLDIAGLALAEHVGVRTTAHKAVASQVDQLERGDLRRYMVHLAGQEKEAPHRRDQDHDRDVKERRMARPGTSARRRHRTQHIRPRRPLEGGHGQHGRHEQQEKRHMILEAHAVHDPWTVMVVPSDACAAQHTMLRTQRSPRHARRTKVLAGQLPLPRELMHGAPHIARLGACARRARRTHDPERQQRRHTHEHDGITQRRGARKVRRIVHDAMRHDHAQKRGKVRRRLQGLGVSQAPQEAGREKVRADDAQHQHEGRQDPRHTRGGLEHRTVQHRGGHKRHERPHRTSGPRTHRRHSGLVRGPRAELLREARGRLALVFARTRIAARFDESLYTCSIPVHDRPVQGRKAIHVSEVHRRTVLEQHVHRERIALKRSPHERRMPLPVLAIQRRLRLELVALEQIHQGHDQAAVCREVQRMKSLTVQQQGISAMIEQQRHNLYMSLARTPVQGRRMERAACGVHIRAAGQQQPAAVIMAIDSGPVQSRHALLVTLIHVRTRIQMRTHTVDMAVLRTRMQRLARHGGGERAEGDEDLHLQVSYLAFRIFRAIHDAAHVIDRLERPHRARFRGEKCETRLIPDVRPRAEQAVDVTHDLRRHAALRMKRRYGQQTHSHTVHLPSGFRCMVVLRCRRKQGAIFIMHDILAKIRVVVRQHTTQLGRLLRINVIKQVRAGSETLLQLLG